MNAPDRTDIPGDDGDETFDAEPPNTRSQPRVTRPLDEREALLERIAAQDAELRAHRERVRMLVSSAPVFMVAVDTDLRILFSHGLELERVGIGANEHIGSVFHEAYPHATIITQTMRRALDGEELTSLHEFRGQTFETRMRPMREADGTIVGAIVVATNVSDRIRAEREREMLRAQMLQAQKLESLGVMAGGIAHDFNNLLTGILGNASVALLELPDDAPGRAAIQDALLAARRAAGLARQLLTYSGSGPRETGALDLSTHAREIAQLVDATVSKKVKLTLDLARDLPAIEGDAAQLQQVVMNLVINGADAIGNRNGTVSISTGVEDLDDRAVAALVAADAPGPGRYVFVDVTDDGAGMDEGTRSRIFDPFFTTKSAGRGLGLAAVVGIMRAHGGGVRIRSELGRGSSFRAYFPATQRSPSILPAPAADMFRGSGVVLVVDDQAPLRAVARRMLEWFGFEVIEAAGGREAIELFRARPADFALVLLDLMMPDLDGEEVFRELRAIRQDVRVLLSSGYAEDDARERFRADGLAGVVAKPYTAQELAARIAKAIDGVTPRPPR